MTAALTPELALAQLAELSSDIRTGVVFDAAGELLAGDPALADPARRLLELADGSLAEVMTPRGCVVAVRGERRALVVTTSRHALPALVRYDVRMVLADLEGSAP